MQLISVKKFENLDECALLMVLAEALRNQDNTLSIPPVLRQTATALSCVVDSHRQ